MARKCQIARETKRMNLINKYKKKRSELRRTRSNINLSIRERENAMHKLNELPRDSSPSRKTTRCICTGKSKSVYRKFMLNRISFRKMASNGLLPGITKSSW
jgi:small subunit ribosomal protein S14